MPRHRLQSHPRNEARHPGTRDRARRWPRRHLPLGLERGWLRGASREPPFAALVVFYLLKGLRLSLFTEPEVELLDVLILSKNGRRLVHDNLADLQDVSVLR